MDNHQAHEDNDKLKAPSEADEAEVPVEELSPPRPKSPVSLGVLILLVAALNFVLYRAVGLEGVWNIAKAAAGLGFMIFIHELGHFLVAKWCDVQVETFSIGFGPAIPGCSFRYGETLYKLAVIPLGGYVKMIGEGDGEEHDDNPRSFKNKPVGQRMAIISAGVTMNILLAFVCFIIAYMMGVRIPVAAVAGKEPGSPAWKNPDVRSGMLIEQIGNEKNPTWEDLKFTVMLSRDGEELPLRLRGPHDDEPVETKVKAVRGEYDSGPKVGVVPLPALKLVPERDAKRIGMKPVSGAAADARVLLLKDNATLKDNAQITRITDPDPKQKEPKKLDPKASNYHAELARIMHAHALRNSEYTLHVEEGAKQRDVEVQAAGFDYGDRIIGMTRGDQTSAIYEPFNVSLFSEDSPDERFEYFAFSRRMQQLAGKVIVVQVQRHKSDEVVNILVPPAFYTTLPIRLKMGKVVEIRDDSPAADAGLQRNDVIEEIHLHVAGQEPFDWIANDSDPMRLQYDLRMAASRGKQASVKMVVNHKGKSKTLETVSWDYGWTYEQEYPISAASPMAISELGIAYSVGPEIAAVDAAAAKEGLEAGDVIYGIRYRTRSKGDEGDLKWSSWMWFGEDEDAAKEKPQAWWPIVFTQLLQGTETEPMDDADDTEAKHIQVRVVRTGSDDYDLYGTPAAEDTPGPGESRSTVRSWPMDDRGFRFELDTDFRKARSPLQAIGMGVKRTYRSIINTYQSFRSMASGRLPVTKNLRGPVSIATMAYEIAGVDLATFLIFLGAINISLAVVNFLPIPILDGGHMVFLIYEKIRGKPASDQVKLGLTYAGLFLLLALMGFVLYLDIGRILKK